MSFRLTHRVRQSSIKTSLGEDTHAKSGHDAQNGVSNEQNGVNDPKPILTWSGSTTPMERRQSRGVTGNLSRRKSRPNSGSIRRSSSISLKHVTELEEEKPSSPTVLRLRALAHAVRARHSLGIQKPAKRKYLLQASESGTDEMDVGVDLLMAGIQTKLKEDVTSTLNYQFTRRRSINNNHDFTMEQGESGSPNTKLSFSKADPNNAERAATTNGSPPGKKPSLRSRKSATVRGSLSKVILQRVNTIRGDLISPLTVYEAKPRNPEVSLDRRQNMGARLTCARSLYKLSCQVGNEQGIIGGGAIAQIADFSDVEDSKILRYSAAILVNVTTDLFVLEDFASKDGVSALLELSWTPLMDVKIACTTALCRLSQTRTRAAVLVRSRAITELMSLLTVPHVPLQQLVVSCIVNLIFYGHAFPDRVFLGDPQAVQSPLGLVSVVSQLSTSSATSQFAIEALFNLSLYRASCLGALRGGGAEILHTLVTQLCRVVDGSAGGTSSSRHVLAFGSNVPSWTADMSTCIKLLRLAADTLANFSAFVEYHSLMGSHGVKALSLLLFGALRDVGNYNPSIATEERFRSTSVPCSRALANFSSNADLRRQNFPQDLIHLAAKLALMDHQRYSSSTADIRALMRNAIRTLSNLSFENSCASAFMEVPQVLVLLHAIIILPPICSDEMESRYSNNTTSQVKTQENIEEDWVSSVTEADENSTNDGFSSLVGSIALDSLSASAPVWYLRSSRTSYATSFPWTTDMSEDAKEDALVAILNLAQQTTYANELLRTLDGKLLAAAAEDMGHSRRLRYIYSSVLCNLLFDSYMQQLVYGDQVARALVSGFNFFETDKQCNDAPAKSDNGNVFQINESAVSNGEKAIFQGLNLASEDDQERFLASIYLIANELMDMANIELVVSLVLPCMQAFINSARAIPSNVPSSHPQRIQLQRQIPIACYASASLFALTRAATQRRDSQKHFVYSQETETTLIAICGLQSGSGLNGNAGESGHGHSSSSRGGVTQAFCAATLYHLCASTSANQRVIQGLINCCNANEETQSLLACSAAFAIISFTAEGCQQLVQCENLARALNRLGRTSQVECQQYAAIAACNVSTVKCVWSSAELKDFIVVALLRANSIQAKQIHAKTLSNLLSHAATRPKVVEDGVLYALMKLSQVMLSGATTVATNIIQGDRRASAPIDNTSLPMQSSSADEVFSIGLRALFNLSCDHKYHPKLLSNGIMAYLSASIECKRSGTSSSDTNGDSNDYTHTTSDPAVVSLLFGGNLSIQRQQTQTHAQQQCLASYLSMESRRFALAIICNLASYEENHKELMRAQVTEIIRNYTDGDIESRASATMALRNLSCRQPWVEMLCERKTLQLLIISTECEHPVVRQFAIEALANCSLVTDSLHIFGELRVHRAVLALLEVTANALPSTTASSLSVSWEISNEQDGEGSQAIVQVFEEREPTSKSTYMAALRCLYNIAHDDALALSLMEESIVLRIVPLLEYRALGEDVGACELVASLTHSLAGKPRCAEALLRQRTVSLCALLHRRHPKCNVIARECVRILMLLSTYQHIQQQLCETQAVHVVVSICSASPAPNVQRAARNMRLRECGAVTIRNLTLCVTEHLALFYDKHDDGDSTLQDVGGNSGSAQRQRDVPKNIQSEDGDNDDGSLDGKDTSVSLMLERHMLHGIKYFQEEIVSGQASDRILLEASAAIANLSTIKVFRVAMVRLGVIQTLLQLMTQTQPKAQRITLTSQSLASTSPVRLRSTYRNTLLGRTCAATLHRLVVEEGAAVDTRSQLVPSLLSVLRQTDEELQQVRYECEKISIFCPSNFDDQPTGVTPPASHGARRFTQLQSRTHLLPRASEYMQQGPAASDKNDESTAAGAMSPSNDCRRMYGSLNAVVSPVVGAVTHCVRQTYREQKWMVYVLKTILSSQSMIPHIEKKHMRTLGLPRLCFQDLTPTFTAPLAPTSTSGDTSSRSSASTANGETSDGAIATSGDALTVGYLLPVNMEKHVIRRRNGTEEIVPISVAEAISPRPRSANAVTTRRLSGIAGLNPRSSSASLNRPQSERDTAVVDPLGHVQKFNRQMRLMRRNDRRDPSSLPPV